MEKNNNKKMSRQTLNGGFRGSRETLKRKTILLFFLIVLPLFLSNFSFFSHDHKIEGVDIENDKFEEISTPITPKTSAIGTFENLTINSGDELYEDRNYDFNSSFHDSANKTKEFTAAELQTKLIGDDVIFNDSISNLNNSETQVALNTSITMINGTSDYANNMTTLDDYYTTYNSTEAGHYPATYSFRADADGSNPTGWSVDLGGGTGTINVIASKDSHRKVVEIDNTVGAQDLILYQALSDKISGTVEFYMRADQNNKWFWLRMWDGGAANTLQFAFSNVGDFRYYDGAWKVLPVPTAYVIDTWYHIKIIFDCSGAFWFPYIDGVAKGNCGYRGNPAAMDYIQFADAADISTFYLDAIGYSWDDDYDVGDNLNMIPSELNFTLTLNFNNYNKDLLAIEVFGYYYTSILQLINFSIWNFTSDTWFLINSSSNSIDFYLSYYMNDTNAFNDFINGTRSIILNFYGVNTTSFFQLFLDYCAVKIYYKLELGISKSFNIKGNWKYRFHVLGSDYYSSWIYFEIIEFIDLNNYASIVCVLEIKNEMLLEEYFSRISIMGYLNVSDFKLYIVGIENITIYRAYDENGDRTLDDSKRVLQNNGSYLSLNTASVVGNSTFELNGIFDAPFGSILPSGTYNTSEAIEIMFYYLPFGNDSAIQYHNYSSYNSGLPTNYYLWCYAPRQYFTERLNLQFSMITVNQEIGGMVYRLYSFSHFRGEYMVSKSLGDWDDTAMTIGGGMNNIIPSVRGYWLHRDAVGDIEIEWGYNSLYSQINLTGWHKDLQFEIPFVDCGNNMSFEVKKIIQLFSRDELIDYSDFQLELNITVKRTADLTQNSYVYNLTENYFYLYPEAQYQFHPDHLPGSRIGVYSINVYYRDELIKTIYFSYNSSENYIDIILPDEYNPKSIYFGLFNYDGLGLSGEQVRFYINNVRKDTGFNEISNSFVNLRVLDYFNTTLFNQNVNLSSYSEYNIIIEVYTMIIFNNYSHEITLEIERNNIEIELSIEAGGFSSPYRFLPNIEYELRAYKLDGTFLEQKTILLEDQVQTVSFGFYSIEVPPEPVLEGDYSIVVYLFIGLVFVIITITIILLINNKRLNRIPKDVRRKYNKQKPEAMGYSSPSAAIAYEKLYNKDKY